MLHNNSKIGATLHYISDSNIDTGSIINIFNLNIDKKKSIMWHLFQLYYGGAEMIKENIKYFELGVQAKSISQSETDSAYFNYPGQQDIDEFNKKYQLFNKADFLEILSKWGIN
jgi:methionyl-tRNA formyltransferase